MSVLEEDHQVEASLPFPLPSTPKKPKKRALPDWRTFTLVERGENGAWVPVRSFTKRSARDTAQTVAYKVQNAEIAILDNFTSKVSVFTSEKQFIPEDKRSATQRARGITTLCKVFVKGHIKLAPTDLCERDRRGRRPNVTETPSSAE